MYHENRTLYTKEGDVYVRLICEACTSHAVMVDPIQLATGIVFLVVSFVGSVYAYTTYDAFRGDIMGRVFGFLSAAFFLLGGAALVLVIAVLVGETDSVFDLMVPATLVSFTLIIVGLIPIFRWIGQSREARSGP
jgi:hypothetical protein